MTKTTISIDEIRAAERETARIRSALSRIGREIGSIRDGKSPFSHYSFNRYSLSDYEGCDYVDQEGPDWGIGTPIISLICYWGSAQDWTCITLPQCWLSDDYRQLETDRVKAERASAELAERADAEAEHVATEQAELDTYNRLKAKFEGQEL